MDKTIIPADTSISSWTFPSVHGHFHQFMDKTTIPVDKTIIPVDKTIIPVDKTIERHQRPTIDVTETLMIATT